MNNNIAVLLYCYNAYNAIGEKNYVGELTCEYKDNPIGIEALNLLLSWKIFSEINNQMQTAYKILVKVHLQCRTQDLPIMGSEKHVRSKHFS